MTGPAFLSASLTFGRHSETRKLATDLPVVIVGPNGSGKTSFVEALLRTIFGFHRKREGDRKLATARRPWNGGPYETSVTLRTADGDELYWSRDFESDEVEVRRADGHVVFAGVANPGSRGSSDRPYWDLVQQVFGVGSLEDYAKTAWIEQGDMLAAAFDADLLRLAEGGHGRLQQALERIHVRHKALTREPVASDRKRQPGERRLERDRLELAEVRRDLAAARSAERERDLAAVRLEEVDAEAGRLDTEIEGLAAARHELAERRRLDAEAEAASHQLDHLVELRSEYEAAQRDVGDAENEVTVHGAFEGYPDGFDAAADRLLSYWDDEQRLSEAVEAMEGEFAEAAAEGIEAALAWLAGTGAVVGAIAAFFTNLAAGWVAAALLMVLAMAIGLKAAERRGTRRALGVRMDRERTELERVRARIAQTLGGVVDAPSLTRANMPSRVEGFLRFRAAARRREAARQRRTEAARRIEEAAARTAPGRSLPLLVADAERRLAEIAARRADLPAIPERPEAFPRTVREIEDRSRERQGRREELRSEREQLLVRLDRGSRVQADAARLTREAAELVSRIDDSERAVEALQAAYALLRDGYEEFRDHDEARLVEAVAGRLDRLGDGNPGAFRAENVSEATVELATRRLSIDSPALSHGERHLVMLAVRLGAADFLAEGGPAAPLIIDEPFAHLDDRHAARVWNLMRDVSVHRQVIVTTQETALLERLGAQATIRFENAAPAPSTNGRRGAAKPSGRGTR